MSESGDDKTTLGAARYGLLFGETDCHRCRVKTPVAAVWVSAYTEYIDGDTIDGYDAGLLQYIEWLDHETEGFVRTNTSWLRPASTRASGTTYWANFCSACGAVQGDHFVFSPDGPYWPQDDTELVRLRFVPGLGALKARASVGVSAWMERVEHLCRRD